MATRIDQLQQIAQQVPNLAQQSATAGKAARTALLQKQLGVAPADKGTAQALGAQQAAMAGQQQLEAMQQTQQGTAQVGQSLIQEQAMAADKRQAQQAMSQQERQAQSQIAMAKRLQDVDIASKKRVTQDDIASAKRLQDAGFEVDQNLQFATEKQRRDLGRLGNDVRAKLLDARLAFDKDDRGRKFSNERQLADYALASAKSQEDFQNKVQAIQQAAKTKEMLTNAIYDRLATIQKQGYISKQGDLDRASQELINKYAIEAKEASARAKADAANSLAMVQGLGMVAGAVGGAWATGGSPEGAMMGASLGGAGAGILNNLLGG